MKVKAIVFTSGSGYTAQYAKLLGEKTALPVYSLENAVRELPNGSEIVYLGWVMASMVKGYKKAAKAFSVFVVCGVCLGTSGSQLEALRKMNDIPANQLLFTLQGGFDMNKLHGMNKFMMKIMRRYIKGQIAKKEQKTPDDEKIVDMLDNGGSAVCVENLLPIVTMLAN